MSDGIYSDAYRIRDLAKTNAELKLEVALLTDERDRAQRERDEACAENAECQQEIIRLNDDIVVATKALKDATKMLKAAREALEQQTAQNIRLARAVAA